MDNGIIDHQAEQVLELLQNDPMEYLLKKHEQAIKAEPFQDNIGKTISFIRPKDFGGSNAS